MGRLKTCKTVLGGCVLILLSMVWPANVVHPRVQIQLLPTLSVNHTYSDNYLETRDNHQEEHITTYGAGISMGIYEKKFKLLY